MNVLLMLAHSIAEYDDLRMLTDLGYDVFSIGAYSEPGAPGDDKRPPLPDVRYHPALHALTLDQMTAKEYLPDGVIDWADVIIVHHYLDQWVLRQWPRIMHKRVIWRTCGQSDPRLETAMGPLRYNGLQIVRYSPAEQRYFEPRGAWAGVDATIRFGKYLDDYPAWVGEGGYVANVTQNMLGRGEHCGLSFYRQATQGLRAYPAGPGSEDMEGAGTLPYPQLLSYLQNAGAYIYTGTVPASYTLGLIEAMLVGVPTVSIGPDAWMGPDRLWEGADLTGLGYDSPRLAQAQLRAILEDPEEARTWSDTQRLTAMDLFDVRKVGAQWREFLGAP